MTTDTTNRVETDDSRPNGSQSGEFTISDVIARLWRNRGVVLLVPLLTLCFGAILVGAGALMSKNPVVYFVLLRGIENEQYPNGTRFTPQDLVGPGVVTRLRSQFDLKAEDIREFVQISYDNPITEGIAQKYRDRLSGRNLTQTDIDAINKAYQEELAATIRRGVRIDVDYVSLGVGKSVGIAIAKAIPLLWSEVYSQQYRIFLDTKLASAAVTVDKLNLSDTAGVLVADARLRAMRNGLGIIATDNRMAALATSDGFTAEDLSEELDRFRTVYFNSLFAAGFGANDPVSRSYLRERELQIADLERRIVGLDQNLNDLRTYQQVVGNANAGPSQTSDRIEISESALGEIVSLAERASFAQYMQGVLSDRQKAVENISQLRQEIARAASPEAFSDSISYSPQASEALQTLTKHYEDLLALARVRSVERAGDLFIALTSPELVESLISIRSILVLVVFGLMGAFAAVLYALLAPGTRRQEPYPAKDYDNLLVRSCGRDRKEKLTDDHRHRSHHGWNRIVWQDDASQPSCSRCCRSAHIEPG